MSENANPKCPQCGAEMPGGTTGRVCPRCAAAFLKGEPTEIPGGAMGSARPFTPPPVAELAALFPQLEIIELIGQGGMGAVYKARQKELDRIVALKILPPGVGGADFAERFAREAKALARLNHPGIVTLYEFGRSNGLFFFLMEYVDGATLRQVLDGGRIAPREALAIVPAICDALQYAHDQGIVHRDIKPENILLDRRGRTKVADFGLAKLMESGGAISDIDSGAGAPASAATQASKVMGTPQYMAPEQVEHPSTVDHRADIYALGVVFYQMLTGEMPGPRVEAPSTKVRIDVRLDEVVLRALEKNPDRRYGQASQIKTAVETIALTSSSLDPLATRDRRVNAGVDYRSKATLFGLPWVHVTSGIDPQTGRVRVAQGIIAIGDKAHGVIAVGGIALGGFTIGGLSLGVFAFGGCAFGLAAFGGLAVALIAAFGGLAVAPIAIGGGAFGYLAFGGSAGGAHVLSAATKEPGAERFFLPWAKVLIAEMAWIIALSVSLCFGIGVGLPLWLMKRTGQPAAAAKSRGKSWEAAGVLAMVMLVLSLWWGYRASRARWAELEAFKNRHSARIEAVTARKGDIERRIAAVGTVESSNSVVFAIDQRFCQEVVRKFDAHQTMAVEATTVEGAAFGRGLLSGVENRIDPATGTLQCKATLFPQGGNLMVPGLFLNVSLLLATEHGMTRVPTTALQREPKGAFVWVIQPDETVRRRPVSVGLSDGQATEIQSGLAPGEMVVGSGFSLLNDGQKISYDLAKPGASEAPGKDLAWLKIQPLDGWIADLQNSDEKVRRTAEAALTEMGTNTLAEILTILSETNESQADDLRRFNTAQALKFMGAGARLGLPAFTALLESGQFPATYSGARALAFSAPAVPEAFTILTNHLRDSSPGVRIGASHGIGLCFNSETNNYAEAALPLLVSNLTDKYNGVRLATANALMLYAQHQSSHFPPLEAKPDLLIPPLIELLRDKYSYVRETAIYTLADACFRDGIKAWMPAIQKLLGDPDEGVRESARNLVQRLNATMATNSTLNAIEIPLFSVQAEATGTNPMTYQWYFIPTNGASATNAAQN